MNSEKDTDPPRTAADTSRDAGRGGLAIAGAKAYFIVAGTVHQFALPHLLGLDGYGALASALSLASIAYNPVISTGIQGVSRAVAGARPEALGAVVRQSFVVHACGAVLLAVLAFILSPLVADALGAPHLLRSFRILCAVLLGYGLYAPLIGALNGQRRLVHQAGFDVFAATVRTFGLIGGAMLFAHAGSNSSGAEGACYGFLAGVIAVLALAFAVVGLGRPGTGSGTVREHVAFVAPLLLGQTLLNLLFQADLTLLRRFAAEAAGAAGLAPTAADPYVGAYRTTQLFSFLPYQLLMAVTFVLFPMLATARRNSDRTIAARYVASGLRIALVLAGAMVSVTAGLSGALLRLFPAASAEYGTRALGVLALGFGAFAIFGLLTAVLNGMGHERSSLLITAGAFALVVAACFGWVRGTALSEALLLRTAIATSGGIAVATLLAGIVTYRVVGSLVPLSVVLRVGAAFGAALALARFLPAGSRLLVVPEAAAVVLVYFGVLLLTRELGSADLELLRRVLRRRA